MSDPFTGARAPDATTQPVTETYPAGTYATSTEPYPPPDRSTDNDESAVKQAAGQSAQAAGRAAGDVKDTAKEQVQRVGSEARTQARTVAADVRDRVGQQARTQNDKLVGGIREMADHLDEMRGDRTDSPAATVVSRVADGGRQFADYLDRNGPEGVLREVQDFARRRPGAFLATALAAGFVVGRLGKGVMKAGEGSDKPASDTFVSGGRSYGTDQSDAYGTQTPDTQTPGTQTPGTQTPGTQAYGTGAYGTGGGTEPPVSTAYTSTGTGTPLVVEETVLDAPQDYPGGTR
jgi:hypothetical protein